MRFQVPQFVDIEDRIVGPLTLKQFGMYAMAVMTLILLYQVVDLALLITLAVPLLGAAALFAHARFAGQSFGAILAHLVSYLLAPRRYLWQRGEKHSMQVYGYEYEELAAPAEMSTSALSLMAQALNTEGSIVSEDAVDPLALEIEKPAIVDKAHPALHGPRVNSSLPHRDGSGHAER